MSLFGWLAAFRESCLRKKNLKMQLQSGMAVGGLQPAGAAAGGSVVWSASAAGASLAGFEDPRFARSGRADGGREPARETMAASVREAPASERGGVSRGAGAALLDMPGLLDPASADIRCLADVPAELREKIQQEGMARAIRRLETPLRALNMATSRKAASYPAEELRGFLMMWRQALGDYLGLVPDERSVLVYDRSVDEAYFVRGRCATGAHLNIIEPCWRLNGEVVIRGEAQVVQGWVR